MLEYSINNKDYLLSLKPSYKIVPLFVLLLLIISILTISCFKTYDVFNTKGYLKCEEKCNIVLGINIEDVNRVLQANYIKINNEKINYQNIKIGDIQIDEINKINIQNVIIEVDQIDNSYLNTFQDVKVYSNYESILKKIKKIIM